MNGGKIIKYVIGAGLVIGGMSYIYYNFIKGTSSFFFKNAKNKIYLSNYINLYLEKLKSKINSLYPNNNWTDDIKILCHINYIVNEINIETKNSLNNLDDKEVKLFIYKNIINIFFEKDLTDLIPFINDNLIFLPENKNFKPLIKHEDITEITSKNDEQKIEDCFFFASAKQLELDKLLENEKFNEAIKFKKVFKIDFIQRYEFDPRFLIDVYEYFHSTNKNSAENSVEDMSLLINKICY